MLLDDLVGVIETLQQRMEKHRFVLQANETRTRMALIDPLLSALGWDTTDPGLVTQSTLPVDEPIMPCWGQMKTLSCSSKPRSLGKG